MVGKLLTIQKLPQVLHCHAQGRGTKSTIITSQSPVKAWNDVIGDKTVANAILDRIVHQAVKIFK